MLVTIYLQTKIHIRPSRRGFVFVNIFQFEVVDERMREGKDSASSAGCAKVLGSARLPMEGGNTRTICRHVSSCKSGRMKEVNMEGGRGF